MLEARDDNMRKKHREAADLMLNSFTVLGAYALLRTKQV